MPAGAGRADAPLRPAVRTGRRTLLVAVLADAGDRLRALVRSRRRLLAGVLVALAAGIAVEAVALPGPPGVAVVAAAADLGAGTVLGAGDLAVVRAPADLLPDGALGADDARGRALAAPVRRGEVVTDARLVGAGLLVGQPAGTVAVPVRPSDPAVAALLRPGDRVRVVAGADPADPHTFTGDGTGTVLVDSASVLVESATVLAVTGSATGGLLGGGDPAMLLLAVRGPEAPVLATAGETRWLAVALLPR